MATTKSFGLADSGWKATESQAMSEARRDQREAVALGGQDALGHAGGS